jgi:hypothetical protein
LLLLEAGEVELLLAVVVAVADQLDVMHMLMLQQEAHRFLVVLIQVGQPMERKEMGVIVLNAEIIVVELEVEEVEAIGVVVEVCVVGVEEGVQDIVQLMYA